LFTPEWAKLLLDNPNSQTLGAQLGDLVVMGSGNNLSQGILVLNGAGNLSLWNVAHKTATAVSAIGGASTANLGLYRIAGGDSGSVGTRFGYLTGGTQYLPATNGSGFGPFTMLQLGQYSTGASLPQTMSLTGDWFMGRGGTGHYIHNYMSFQAFSCQSIECVLGTGGTGLGTADLVRSYQQGQSPSAQGLWGTALSLLAAFYGSAMYRPVYEMTPCPQFGPNYC
jgi:hypothetical protein